MPPPPGCWTAFALGAGAAAGRITSPVFFDFAAPKNDVSDFWPEDDLALAVVVVGAMATVSGGRVL